MKFSSSSIKELFYSKTDISCQKKSNHNVGQPATNVFVVISSNSINQFRISTKTSRTAVTNKAKENN